MKKLLLTLATALVSFSGFAQDITEESPTVNPGWTVRVNITEPPQVASDNTYEMIKRDVQIKGSDVYSQTFEVQVSPEAKKSSKYYVYVSYTSEDGTVKTVNTSALYQTIEDGNINITVSAFLGSDGKIKYVLSNSKYLICDTNWTGIGYFDAHNDGVSQEVYFNNTSQKGYVSIRNLGAATSEYIPGGNSQYKDILNVVNNVSGYGGLAKATFDYVNATVTLDKVSEVNLEIKNYIPFVAATSFTLPSNLKAYSFSEYSQGVLKVAQITQNTVPANQPVILVAQQSGTYTLTLNNDYNFNYIGEVGGSRAFISDTCDEGSVFYGVHQPHSVPAGSYTFDGEKFVKANTSDIITALNCYVKVDDDFDLITIEFPKEEPEEPVEPKEDVLYVHFTDQTGKHLQTHWTVLEKKADGTYANEVDIANFDYFVLSDANFKPTVSTFASFDGDLSERNWSDLGDAYIYHVSSTSAFDNVYTTSNTINFAKTKASELAGEFTPFAINGSGYVYKIVLDPVSETTTMTNSGITTGIGNVIVDDKHNYDGRIFNVYGQQVDENYKGIVIINGKKIVRK